MALTAGATIAGAAATTAVAVETVMMVGMVLTVAGIATKDEKLTKIGTGLGLGGGIGGMAGAGSSTASQAAQQTGRQAGQQSLKSGMTQAAGMPASSTAMSSTASTGIGLKEGMTTAAGLSAPSANSGMSSVAQAAPAVSQSSGYGGSFFDSISDFWGGLDAGDKSMIAGGIQGAGKAAASYIASDNQRKFAEQQEENRIRRANEIPRLISRAPVAPNAMAPNANPAGIVNRLLPR